MSSHQIAEHIHSQLSHPVIDSDGHWIEFEPAAMDYLHEVAGERVAERYTKVANQFGNKKWAGLSEEERKDRRMLQPAWWGVPTKNTRDRATAMLPKLLYERLDEFGIDFGVIYPTGGALFAPFLRDDEIRRAACRAFNMYTADQFEGLEDRLTPAAVVPMFTPEEAVEELEFIKSKGFKVAMLSSLIRRQVPAVARKAPEAGRYAIWHDTLGIDSEHDYDPVWAKCLEVGIPPSFHSASSGIGMRASISNFVYNHIGHFAQAGEAVCKSIFMNGVTRRFPELRFAFLEGGVGWACGLYSDLIGHWKIRNPKALDNVNPANLNQEMLVDLFQKYGFARGGGKAGAEGDAGPSRPAYQRAGKTRRFCALRDRARRGHPRPVCAEFLLWLRGRRSAERLGFQHYRQSVWRQDQRAVWLGHRSLRCAGHGRRVARGV